MGRQHTQDLGKALSHSKTDKRIDILRRLQDAGSISEAARRAGVSYKAAWQAIDILSNLAGTPLVEKVVGGAGGGGAQLTTAGKELLKASSDLELAKNHLVKKASTQSSPTDSPVSLGLRTTMRNQFPCTVSSVVKKTGHVRVALTTKGGTVFHSKITAASAELFELHIGQQVLVLCKATAVQIKKTSSDKDKNVVHGIVVRKSRGRASGEINLLVEPGVTIVGFAELLSDFNISDEAIAELDDAAVVLALNP